MDLRLRFLAREIASLVATDDTLPVRVCPALRHCARCDVTFEGRSALCELCEGQVAALPAPPVPMLGRGPSWV